jgi:hypothetical protein
MNTRLENALSRTKTDINNTNYQIKLQNLFKSDMQECYSNIKKQQNMVNAHINKM